MSMNTLCWPVSACASGGNGKPFAEPEQHFLAAVHVVDIPAAEEGLEHQVLLVGIEHLLGANDERDLAEPGLDLSRTPD